MPRAFVRNLRRLCKDSLRQRFERLLFDELERLGFDILEQSWSPDDPLPWQFAEECPGGADRILYEHRSRPQAPDGHLFYMETYFNGLFTLDPRGWGPLQADLPDEAALARIDAAEATQRIEALSRQLLADGSSKHRQPAPDRFASPVPRYIFIPLQLSQDDTILHHASTGVADFIDMIGRWSHDHAIDVVFKLHPFNTDAAVHDAVMHWVAMGRAHHCEANIHRLIRDALGVYTINSGCGFESLIHGKPVVTFGACDYDRVTFHGHAGNLSSAWQYVLDYSPAEAAAAYRWVHFYLCHHVVDVRSDDLSGPRAQLRRRLRNILTPQVATMWLSH